MASEVSLLTVAQVCERCALSRSTLYRLIGSSEFPQPVCIDGRRAVRWRSDAVTDWIEQLSSVSASV